MIDLDIDIYIQNDILKRYVIVVRPSRWDTYIRIPVFVRY